MNDSIDAVAGAGGAPSWRETVHGKIATALESEIDVFEAQIQARKRGEVEERVFAEIRLRRGAYGQRYDSIQTQTLPYPSSSLTKGLNTMWDAPGMQRIKIPFGGLSADQMDVLAAVAEG